MVKSTFQHTVLNPLAPEKKQTFFPPRKILLKLKKYFSVFVIFSLCDLQAINIYGTLSLTKRDTCLHSNRSRCEKGKWCQTTPIFCVELLMLSPSYDVLIFNPPSKTRHLSMCCFPRYAAVSSNVKVGSRTREITRLTLVSNYVEERCYSREQRNWQTIADLTTCDNQIGSFLFILIAIQYTVYMCKNNKKTQIEKGHRLVT